MINEKDYEYCGINQPSDGIFPSYFLIDLKLNEDQKAILNRLIGFLTGVAKRHTPPPPKTCPTCGMVKSEWFDTWMETDYLFVNTQIRILKNILEPNRIDGDHT